MTQTLRVALIGCGRMGAIHAQSLAAHPHARLVGVCDTLLESARQLANTHATEAFASAAELISATRPQIAIVATPDHLHRDVALAAIEARCHVFCEKPLAHDVDTAAEMVHVAAAANVQLAVNFNRRFGFAYREAKQLLARAEWGNVRSLTMQVIDAVPPAAVIRRPDVMLTTLLTHHFDLLRFLAGEVATVSAAVTAGDQHLYRGLQLTFELASGAQASIGGEYRDKYLRTTEQATVHTDRGTLRMHDVIESLEWYSDAVVGVQEKRPGEAEAALGFYGTARLHLHDFLDRLLVGQPPSIPGHDGLAAMHIAAAAARSCREQKKISLLV